MKSKAFWVACAMLCAVLISTTVPMQAASAVNPQSNNVMATFEQNVGQCKTKQCVENLEKLYTLLIQTIAGKKETQLFIQHGKPSTTELTKAKSISERFDAVRAEIEKVISDSVNSSSR